MRVMVQDNVLMCPKCAGALRKIYSTDIKFVCVNKDCATVLKIVGEGQSQRELECEVIQSGTDN